jgi:hypothetical protein
MLAGLTLPASASILIDGFSDQIGPAGLLIPGGNATDSETDPVDPSASYLGERTTTFTVTTHAQFPVLGVVLGDDELSFGTGPGEKAEFDISYQSLGGLDITEGGLNDTLAIDLVSSDLDEQFAAQGGPQDNFVWDITFSITDTNNNVAQVSTDLFDEGTLSVSLGDFAGVDLEDVATIAFDVDPGDALGTAADFRLDTFRAVPEPSTYAAIFGALALGLAVVRRRLRRG